MARTDAQRAQRRSYYSQLTEEQKARRKAYHDQWRAENRAHLAKKQAEYRKTHPEARATAPARQAYMKAYRAKNRARLLDQSARYYRDHPEKFAQSRLKSLQKYLAADPTRSLFTGGFAFVPLPPKWDRHVADETEAGLPAWEILARREENLLQTA